MKKEKKQQIRTRTILVDVLGLTNLIYLWCKFLKCCDIPGLEIISTFFLIALLSYTKKKAEVRALGAHTRKRRGELWVFAWGVSATLMIVLNSVFRGYFILPQAELGIILPIILFLYVDVK